jgi:histidinol-phosphatase (PHP family)
MALVNYHSHTHFCDGKAHPEEFIKAAVEKGFTAYGISSHAPVPFRSEWNMNREDVTEYIDIIDDLKIRYKDRIEIYKGFEIDYIEGFWSYTDSFLSDLHLDYFIGSVHYIERLDDGSFFCFDGKPGNFFETADQYYKRDFRKIIEQYYYNVRQMVINDKPDIIGHVDKIKMHNTIEVYLDENESWYKKQVEDTLDVISSAGSIVEVNTRGLYRHDPPLLYPGQWILKRMKEKKIPAMVNSDSHHPSEINLGYDIAFRALYEAGFSTVRALLGGKWQDVEFDKNGIRL